MPLAFQKTAGTAALHSRLFSPGPATGLSACTEVLEQTVRVQIEMVPYCSQAKLLAELASLKGFFLENVSAIRLNDNEKSRLGRRKYHRSESWGQGWEDLEQKVQSLNDFLLVGRIVSYGKRRGGGEVASELTLDSFVTSLLHGPFISWGLGNCHIEVLSNIAQGQGFGLGCAI